MYTILYVIKRQLIIAITMISLFSNIFFLLTMNYMNIGISIIICPKIKRIKKNQLVFFFVPCYVKFNLLI